MQRRLILVAALVGLSFFLCGDLAGRMMRRTGKYWGVVVVDRWGQKILQSGPGIVFLSDDVYGKLKDQAGKPIEITVTELHQTDTSQGGMIKAISGWAPRTPKTPAELQVSSKTRTVRQGQGLAIEVQVSNPTRADVDVWASCFAIVLVSKEAVAVPSWNDPDQCAYWYYGECYIDTRPNGKDGRQVYNHEHGLKWSAQMMVVKGSGVAITRSHEGDARFAPGVRFTATEVVGQELPPGQYQAFAAYRASDKGYPMSQRIDFDVSPDATSQPATTTASSRPTETTAKRPPTEERRPEPTRAGNRNSQHAE